MTTTNHIRVDPEVADALADRRPVVALESTVFSTLGLPEPHNQDALAAAHETVRNGGAVPAMTAVIDGQPCVGVPESHWEKILVSDRKVAARDLPVAVARRWPTGVTTVSASVALASAVGIRVFATGGIGGVHRDAATSDDVSADLLALSTYPVVTVCAGAKSFLDLGRTLERLETLSVPVLGFGTDELPAFTARGSGLPVPHRVESASEVAAIAAAQFLLGRPVGGLLVTVPPPEPIEPESLAAASDEAEARATAQGIVGAARTPFVLGQIAELTGGRSVAANIALVANNARVASEIATESAIMPFIGAK